jgi:hypothetical protein
MIDNLEIERIANVMAQPNYNPWSDGAKVLRNLEPIDQYLVIKRAIEIARETAKTMLELAATLEGLVADDDDEENED